LTKINAKAGRHPTKVLTSDAMSQGASFPTAVPRDLRGAPCRLTIGPCSSSFGAASSPGNTCPSPVTKACCARPASSGCGIFDLHQRQWHLLALSYAECRLRQGEPPCAPSPRPLSIGRRLLALGPCNAIGRRTPRWVGSPPMQAGTGRALRSPRNAFAGRRLEKDVHLLQDLISAKARVRAGKRGPDFGKRRPRIMAPSIPRSPNSPPAQSLQHRRGSEASDPRR
jgi:hypothetical protein